jgi:hypothetical protein
MKRGILLLGVLGATGLACGGGDGPLPGPLPSHDTPHGSFDYPPAPKEPVGQGMEQNPGGNCPTCRTYMCTSGGQSTSIDFTTSMSNGCITSSGNSQLVLECNGTVSVNGNNIGTWSQSANCLTFCEQGACLNCN